jgi:hypothetical protein
MRFLRARVRLDAAVPRAHSKSGDQRHTRCENHQSLAYGCILNLSVRYHGSVQEECARTVRLYRCHGREISTSRSIFWIIISSSLIFSHSKPPKILTSIHFLFVSSYHVDQGYDSPLIPNLFHANPCSSFAIVNLDSCLCLKHFLREHYYFRISKGFSFVKSAEEHYLPISIE